jgi:NADH-quinone oxidoreductase subunit E
VNISVQAEQRLSELKSRYPDSKSAVMAALYIAQEELGSLNEAAVQWVSERTGVAPVHVMELASFYSMYYRKPVGRYHFQVCRTLSCALRGSRRIVEYLKERFKIEPGQVSADGLWSYEEVECLGACGGAPACEINDCYFENLTAEKLGEIIDRVAAEKPDLRYSTIKDSLGEGLKGCPKSVLE